jgi:hypothetical protein
MFGPKHETLKIKCIQHPIALLLILISLGSYKRICFEGVIIGHSHFKNQDYPIRHLRIEEIIGTNKITREFNRKGLQQ